MKIFMQTPFLKIVCLCVCFFNFYSFSFYFPANSSASASVFIQSIWFIYKLLFKLANFHLQKRQFSAYHRWGCFSFGSNSFRIHFFLEKSILCFEFISILYHIYDILFRQITFIIGNGDLLCLLVPPHSFPLR